MRPSTREPSADAVAANRSVRWTRWTGETEDEFRERVLADAARLGTRAIFAADKGRPGQEGADRPARWNFGAWRDLS